MKDKLIKTGHKKGYYRLKAVLTVGLFSLAAFVASAVPIGIGLKIAEAEAQEDALAETSEKSEQTSEQTELLAF